MLVLVVVDRLYRVNIPSNPSRPPRSRKNTHSCTPPGTCPAGGKAVRKAVPGQGRRHRNGHFARKQGSGHNRCISTVYYKPARKVQCGIIQTYIDR